MTPEKIIIHHSLTRDDRTVSWNAIRRYHVETLGWADVGYHFGIEFMRDGYEIVMGRMPYVIGAHTKYHNSNSLGICFVGNFDLATVPDPQWDKGLELVRWLLANFNLRVADVWPHNAFNGDKSCPGRLFDIARFCAEL